MGLEDLSNMRNFGLARLLGVVFLMVGGARGAQMTAAADIGVNVVGSFTGASATYVGPNGGNGDYRGAVLDGGFDSFDGFGRYGSFSGDLTLNRRVELLTGNVYRWVDTFTNTGANAILTGVNFNGNLGSDAATAFTTVNAYFQVSTDNCLSCDPVVGFIWGNNVYASTFTRAQFSDVSSITIPLTLAPGETKSLMFFAFLAREDTNRVLANDVALATNTMNALFAAPNITGLSALEQSQIVNWGTVPEPGTYVSLGSALAVLAWWRKRRG